MRQKTTWILACALAGGLIAAGCGGGDDGNDSTGNGATTAAESLSKGAFIAQADQICKEGNDELDQAGKDLGNPPSADELESFATNTVIPNIQNQLDQIKALGAPAGDEDQVNEILDTAQQDLDALKSDPSQIEGNTFADANKLANDYGLKVCGND